MMDPIASRDAEHKERAYRGLALHYLRSGQPWLALHAQTVADVSAATLVAGFPVQELHQQGVVTPSLVTFLSSVEQTALASATTVADALAVVRTGIRSTLEPSQWSAWADRLTPMSAFDAVPLGETSDQPATILAHADGLTLEARVAHQLEKAATGYAEASRCHAAGDVTGETRATFDADIATFTAWLIARSLAFGDLSLTQAEMKWELASDALNSIGASANDGTVPTSTVRSRLAWALGPNDAHEFAHYLAGATAA